jgi:hypothetical protein
MYYWMRDDGDHEYEITGALPKRSEFAGLTDFLRKIFVARSIVAFLLQGRPTVPPSMNVRVRGSHGASTYRSYLAFALQP